VSPTDPGKEKKAGADDALTHGWRVLWAGRQKSADGRGATDHRAQIERGAQGSLGPQKPNDRRSNDRDKTLGDWPALQEERETYEYISGGHEHMSTSGVRRRANPKERGGVVEIGGWGGGSGKHTNKLGERPLEHRRLMQTGVGICYHDNGGTDLDEKALGEGRGCVSAMVATRGEEIVRPHDRLELTCKMGG